MRKKFPATIAIITDFGTSDWFVASMKGQILRQWPDARIVDITHEIPPGSVWEASYVLASCFNDFPPGTLFMVVVDPRVGTDRKAILGRVGKSTVLCPNNGIISHTLHYHASNHGPFYEVLPEHSNKDTISSTFHGRDIFAPIAGKIANGILTPEDLGNIVHKPERLNIAKTEIKKGVIHGVIEYIDHFGNAITNISENELSLFKVKSSACVIIKNKTIAIKSTFAEVEKGQLLTYIGSNGFLEIAVNLRNAAETLHLKIGDDVYFHINGNP